MMFASTCCKVLRKSSLFNKSSTSNKLMCMLAVSLRRFKSEVHCIDRWTIPVRSTGFAVVNTHFTTYIKPLDPLEYIEKPEIWPHKFADGSLASARVSLNLRLPQESDLQIDETFVDELTKDIRYNPQLNIERHQYFLVVKGRPQRKFSFPPEDITIVLEVPTQFSVQVNASDNADVHVENLEGGWIYDITTDQGSCYLSKLKGQDLHVLSSNGNIISKNNLVSEFGILAVENDGKICVNKLQGRKFCLDSKVGSISTGALYLQRGEVTSETGDISLGDIHGIMEVKQEKGDICIGSVSGDLHAVTNEGSIKLHLSEPRNIQLKVKQGGNITMTTNEEPLQPTAIHVKAKDINIHPEMQMSIESKDEGENFTVLTGVLNSVGNDAKLDEHQNTWNVEVKHGAFNLKRQDWLSSLNLKNISES